VGGTAGLDLSVEPKVDLAAPDLADAPPPDLAGYDLSLPVAPGTLDGAQLAFAGLDVLDVSADQGGGLWAVTAQKVYYLPPGAGAPFTYDQSNGLARGLTTYHDTYYSPGDWPVTFSAVAGAHAGEAVVGNIGAIADRLEVDPSTGAVQRVDNMQVTSANTSPAELPYHLQRVIGVWKVVVDLNGTLDGTAYLGGLHGFYAFHGLSGSCGCLAFEEHQHYTTQELIGGGDTRALAITPAGDVWAGDRDFVSLLPQRSLGPSTGLFDANFTVGLDVFPGVRDEVHGLAVAPGGGVYVASNGQGLAYLPPGATTPTFTAIGDGHLTAVEVDAAGDVWIATQSSGMVRYRPSGHTFNAYSLVSNTVHTLTLDRYSATRRLLVATAGGVVVYSGP
jgi:streptogramin lyase